MVPERVKPGENVVYVVKLTRDDDNKSDEFKVQVIVPEEVGKDGSFNLVLNYEAMHEAKILNKLKHPNIISFYGMSETPQNQPILCTELMDKSLKVLLYSTQCLLTLQIKLHISLEIAKGLEYLHEQHYVHRDLKPGNICVNYNDQNRCITGVKLIDCGGSRAIPVPDTPDQIDTSVVGKRRMTANVGTPVYMAPELTSTDKSTNYHNSVDIYSFGILLWEIMYRERPYANNGAQNMFTLTRNIIYDNTRPTSSKSNEKQEAIPIAIRELWTECWSHEPDKRPTASQLVRRLTKLVHRLTYEQELHLIVTRGDGPRNQPALT